MAQNQFIELRQKTVVKNNLVNPTNLAFCIGEDAFITQFTRSKS